MKHHASSHSINVVLLSSHREAACWQISVAASWYPHPTPYDSVETDVFLGRGIWSAFKQGQRLCPSTFRISLYLALWTTGTAKRSRAAASSSMVHNTLIPVIRCVWLLRFVKIMILWRELWKQYCHSNSLMDLACHTFCWEQKLLLELSVCRVFWVIRQSHHRQTWFPQLHTVLWSHSRQRG